MWFIHVMEYDSAIKGKGMLTRAATRMDLKKDSMFTEVRATARFHLMRSLKQSSS